MVMVHQRPEQVEVAVARAACAVADAETELARARRGLRRAWGAYAARLAGGDRPRAAATTTRVADLGGDTKHIERPIRLEGRAEPRRWAEQP